MARPDPTDEELTEFIEAGVPLETLARLYKMTGPKMQARINRIQNAPDQFVIDEYDGEQNADTDRLAFNKIQHPNARALLLAYTETGTVTDAARAARIDRTTHYHWLESLDGYADAFKQAEGMFADSLERSALLRARDGVEKPVFQGGFEVGRVREYSDTLMMAMLKAKRPDQYKERPAAAPTSDDLAQFDDAELERIAAGEPYERVFASARRRRVGETPPGEAPGAESAPAH